MTKKVTLIHVVVHRDVDGQPKRIHPPIGKIFDYTDKEIEEILTAKKNGLRDPKNEEDASMDDLLGSATSVETEAPPAPKNARAAKAAAKSDDI